MDMLRKLVEEKMKKGVHSENSAESSKKKSAALGVLAHISRMAEGAMADDMKNEIGKTDADTVPGSGMDKGLRRAEELVSKEGEPLDTNEFDNEESDHDESEEDKEEKHSKY